MSKLPVKILGTGIYLPKCLVKSEELEERLGVLPGSIEKASGVKKRYFVTEETTSSMGAIAAEKALEAAKISKSEIDAVVFVGGVCQQAIPSTAALIHQKLGIKKAIALDINATCLSFVMGFYNIGNLIASGVYKNVLLVSSDIASVGLNPKDLKTASLFGDGAAACVLGPSEKSGIIDSYFETNSEFCDACQCKGGGTLLASNNNSLGESHYFQMNGIRLFKAAIPSILRMIKRLTNRLEKKVNLVIPHQASPSALDHIQKKLKFEDHQFMNIVRDFGNMIATSIPFALHKAIETGRLRRGDRALLCGTAAGLTVGGILIEY